MKFIRRLLKKIKAIDILTVILLLAALGMAGYISMEKAKDMNDSFDMYVAEDDEDIQINDFGGAGT